MTRPFELHRDETVSALNHSACNARLAALESEVEALTAQLSAASHRAIVATDEADLAKGLLRRLLAAQVIEVPYILDGDWYVVDGSDGYRTAIVTDAEAALLDTIKETT